MGENLSGSLSSLMTNSPSWNLSNDDALLDVLKSVSQNFLSRTNQLLDKMDKLSRDTASVQIRLDTANNNFMLLSNIKFIEARVYDDNEEEQQEQTNKVTDQIESEDSVVTDALRCGTDLVMTAFEKVVINDSDTESDAEGEGEKDVYVLQPKNSYHLRSLPNIIGTKEWLSDDKVGLGEEDREDEVNGDEETESESDDEDLLEEKKADVSDYSESENEDTARVSPPRPIKDDADNEQSDRDTASEFSDDDDLFRPKIQSDLHETQHLVDKDNFDEEDGNMKEEADQDSTDVKVIKKTSFADELALKLGGSSAPTATNNPKLEVVEKKVDRREDENPSARVNKKSALFDSSDSDDDLFSPKPPLPKIASKPKPKVSPGPESRSSEVKKDSASGDVSGQSKSFVTEESKNSAAEVLEQTQTKAIEKPMPKVTAKKPALPQRNLFSDSSDEDDIFVDLKVGVKTENTNGNQKKSFLDISDGSDSDDIFSNLGADLKHKKEVEEHHITDDDDAFSTSTTEKPISETKTPESVEPETHKNEGNRKTPVGGVSLFAGFNPANIFKKKPPVSSDDEPDDDKETPGDDPPVESGNDTGTVIGNIDKTISDTRESASDVTDTADFMTENKTEVLTTLTKSRPRVGGRRRPPTRSARKKEALSSVFQDTTDGLSEDKEEENEEETTSDKKPMFIPPIGGVSLFGNMNPKDLLKKKPKVEDSNDVSPGDSGSSLFENLLTKKKRDVSAINSKSDDFTEETDDIFAAKSSIVDEVQNDVSSFEPPPMEDPTPKKISLDLFDADSDSDDLFSDLLEKKTDVSNKAADVNNLFGDDDDEFDDLFSSLIKK